MIRTALYFALTGAMTVVLLCAPQSSPAFQGSGPGSGPGCREPGIFRCIENLDLSQAQITDIETLRTETRSKLLPLRAELRNLEIPEALFAADIDTAELESLLHRKKNINAEIIEIRHEAMVSAVQLLTPEQRATMRERKNSPAFFPGKGRRGAGRRADCPW